MIKLNAGFSRKVGEPNYGSRGASVNVELELESGLISDPDAFMTRIHSLFEIARRSVDEELNNTPVGNGHMGRTHDNQPPPGGRFNPQNLNHRENVRYATTSQVRAIRAIGQRQSIDANRAAADRFGVSTVENLTLQQASSLIDDLKATQANGGNGGRR